MTYGRTVTQACPRPFETFDWAWTRLRRPPGDDCARTARPGLPHTMRRDPRPSPTSRCGAARGPSNSSASPRRTPRSPRARCVDRDERATTRRRLQRTARDGVITFRCDLAHPFTGALDACSTARQPPHPSRGTGNASVRKEEVRLAVSVSGSGNLLVTVRLRGLHAVGPFEARLAERFPHPKVSEAPSSSTPAHARAGSPTPPAAPPDMPSSPCRRFDLFHRARAASRQPSPHHRRSPRWSLLRLSGRCRNGSNQTRGHRKRAPVPVLPAGSTAKQKEAVQKRPLTCDVRSFEQSGRQDLNLRPLDPQSSALPSCATSRCPL